MSQAMWEFGEELPVASAFEQFRPLDAWWAALGLPAPEHGLPKDLARAYRGEYAAFVQAVRTMHAVMTQAPEGLQTLDFSQQVAITAESLDPAMRGARVPRGWDFIFPTFNEQLGRQVNPRQSFDPDRTAQWQTQWDALRAQLNAQSATAATARTHQLVCAALERPRPVGLPMRGWYPLPWHGDRGVEVMLGHLHALMHPGLRAGLDALALNTTLPTSPAVPRPRF